MTDLGKVMQINEVPEATLAAFREAARAAYEKERWRFRRRRQGDRRRNRARFEIGRFDHSSCIEFEGAVAIVVRIVEGIVIALWRCRHRRDDRGRLASLLRGRRSSSRMSSAGIS